MPFNKNKYVQFDTLSGEVFYLSDSENTHQGLFEKTNEFNIALYKDINQTTIIQINKVKYKLLDEETEIEYFHDFDNKKTIFKIKNFSKSTIIKYDSWWSHIPNYIPLQPELDEDEDFLAYVYTIWKSNK